MPGIFISYRRADSPDATGRIYDCLVSEFGRAKVFKDIDSIPLGRDFRSHLNEIVGDCAAVLAIVGPRWTDMRDDAGKRRLEDADDFVRIELEAALARNIPVVPVLVGHAVMPGAGQLPASLAQLAFRQSIEVRPDPDFHNDSTRLVSALRRIIDPDAPDVDESPDNIALAAGAAKRERQLRRRLLWAISSAVVATIAAAALLVPSLRHLRETPPPETRTDIVTPATGQAVSFALSPDGRQIVYVAAGSGESRLWLRSLATTTVQPLAGTEGAVYPFWSPDSRSIGFFGGGALKRLDLGGGAPQALAAASVARGATWSANDVILFSPNTAAPLMRVAASGGAAVAVTTLGPQQASHRHPQFLPDGRRFLFFLAGTVDTTGIYIGALDGSTPVRLTFANSAGVYLPGWLLWVRAGTLVAQRLDLAKATLTGEPVTLADGIAIDSFNRSAVTVAAMGLVAFRKGGGGGRQLSWFDRTGTARGTVGEPDGSYFVPRVFPDGRRVLVARTVQGNIDLWLLDGARTSRISFDAAQDYFPVLSPDGTRIAFRSARMGGGDLYQKLTNGAGAEELLLHSDQPKTPYGWSADGRFLLYASNDPKSDSDLWILPMMGEHTPTVFLKTPFRESAGVFSPDGRWVAYMSNESGRQEIYVRPFVPPGPAGKADGSAGQWQVSTAGGTWPAWRHDGEELYYLNPEGAMMAAKIGVNGATLEPGAPVRLFATRIVGGGTDALQGRQYDIGADGRFLINTESDSAAEPITLIQNWKPEAAGRN